MSSFLVADETIDAICFELDRDAMDCAIISPCEEMDKLGRELKALNYRALNARYGDEIPAEVEFSFRNRHVDRFVRLRAMRLWLYQCSEGDCPKDPLYRRVENRIYSLALTIVSEMPEYKKAKAY